MRAFSFIIPLLITVTLYGQDIAFRTALPLVNSVMNKGINNAERFISNTVSDKIYQEHFKLSLSLSEVIKDASSSYNPIYFNDTITVIPNKYELRYSITVNNDTLDDSFIIPIDSLGNADIDTSNFHYILDDLKAYKKLLSGQYKFDYLEVKKFIKSKGLNNYSVRLMNSSARIYDKDYYKAKVHKHFWYVYLYLRGKEYVYRIDPDTGKYTKFSRKAQVVA